MEPAPARPRSLLIWLILSQVLALGSLLFWVVPAGLSVMAFGSGGGTAEAWTIVRLIWLYPLLPVAFSIGGWVAYAGRKNWLAVILSSFSFLPPVLLFGLFILVDILRLIVQ